MGNFRSYLFSHFSWPDLKQHIKQKMIQFFVAIMMRWVDILKMQNIKLPNYFICRTSKITHTKKQLTKTYYILTMIIVDYSN